jgi:hypothetical protein
MKKAEEEEEEEVEVIRGLYSTTAQVSTPACHLVTISLPHSVFLKEYSA